MPGVGFSAGKETRAQEGLDCSGQFPFPVSRRPTVAKPQNSHNAVLRLPCLLCRYLGVAAFASFPHIAVVLASCFVVGAGAASAASASLTESLMDSYSHGGWGGREGGEGSPISPKEGIGLFGLPASPPSPPLPPPQAPMILIRNVSISHCISWQAQHFRLVGGWREAVRGWHAWQPSLDHIRCPAT